MKQFSIFDQKLNYGYNQSVWMKLPLQVAVQRVAMESTNDMTCFAVWFDFGLTRSQCAVLQRREGKPSEVKWSKSVWKTFMFVLSESHLDFQNLPSDLKTEVEHNLSKVFFITLKVGSN